MERVYDKYVMVGDIRTHYLEAGEGDPVILLHSGEFGGCAELSWEYNIGALAKHFHVYAPDWLGFGKTDKIFDFTNMFQRRVDHIRQFMEIMCIEGAYFIGNSMGGGVLATVAAKDKPDWPIKKIVLASSAGHAPDNEHRQILNTYDCTREHMKNVLSVLFYDEKWANDEAYVEKRYQLSLEPGAWEATAAARFKSPAASSQSKSRRPDADLSNIKVPTLIVAGKEDYLRLPGYAVELQKEIPNSKLHVFEKARHCPHIEHADEFNKMAIDFFLRD